MSDIVTRLRAMHLETAMPIYCAAANAIEKAEAERDLALRAFLHKGNSDYFKHITQEQSDALYEAARKLGGEMTDKPMTMRERLAQAIARNAEAQAQADGPFAPYCGEDDRLDDVILDGHFDLYQFVDALLDVLETPSEAVLGAAVAGYDNTYELNSGDATEIIAAMVKAIRGGA